MGSAQAAEKVWIFEETKNRLLTWIFGLLEALMLIFGISSLSCVGFWHRELLACPVSLFPDAFCFQDNAEKVQEEVQNRDLMEMREKVWKKCGKNAGKASDLDTAARQSAQGTSSKGSDLDSRARNKEK